MARATIYCRFSPRPDAETSESNNTQLDRCRDYCRAHEHEIDEDRILLDPDVSGAANRPKLWEAIACLGRGDVLVATEWDRLARDVYLAELIRREVRRRGARIEVVNGHNGQSDTDIAIQQVLAAFDALDRKTKAARTSAAMKRHQRLGRAMGGEPPYGKMRGPDQLATDHHGNEVARRTWIDNPDEQPILAQILDHASRGWTPGAISSMLNNKGVPCRGSRWYRKTIVRILERESALT